MLRFLLNRNDHKINIDFVFEIVCRNGDFEEAKYLIENFNADPRKTFDHALRQAIYQKNYQFAKYLIIEHKCSPHMAIKEMIEYASTDDDFDFIKYLINCHGCSTNTTNKTLRLYEWACYKGKFDFVKYLINDRKYLPYQLSLAPKLAFQGGHLPTVKFLIKFGHFIDENMFFISGHVGNLNIVKYCVEEREMNLEKLANHPQFSGLYGNPLQNQTSRDDFIKYYVEKGLDINRLHIPIIKFKCRNVLKQSIIEITDQFDIFYKDLIITISEYV